MKEVRLFEFGPTTWPAYVNASAGVRSEWSPARRKRALVLLDLA